MGELLRGIVKGAETFARKGAEVAIEGAKKAPEMARRAGEAARRMSERIRPGRNPDRVLRELASMPTKKSETFFSRMRPPARTSEDDDERRRKQGNVTVIDNRTQLGLIQIG